MCTAEYEFPIKTLHPTELSCLCEQHLLNFWKEEEQDEYFPIKFIHILCTHKVQDNNQDC